MKDGEELPADFLVVGVGARPRVGLFEDQLEMAKGGIKVSSRLYPFGPECYRAIPADATVSGSGPKVC